jgi:hypothetical protein
MAKPTDHSKSASPASSAGEDRAKTEGAATIATDAGSGFTSESGASAREKERPVQQGDETRGEGAQSSGAEGQTDEERRHYGPSYGYGDSVDSSWGDRPPREREPIPDDEGNSDDVELPEQVFDEIADKRGTKRRLSVVKKISVEELDPIVDAAVREVRDEYEDDADENEEVLSTEYYAVAEAVTERLNRRQLSPVTRLLLSQRSIYLALLKDQIEKMAASEGAEAAPHVHRESRAHRSSASK